MIHRDAQAAFYRYDFPKWRSPRRTRSRGDLPRDFPFGERILAAKTARKTDDFPKWLLSPRGTRAGDDRVPTHVMLRAALKQVASNSTNSLKVPTYRMLRAAWDDRQNSTVLFLHSAVLSKETPLGTIMPRGVLHIYISVKYRDSAQAAHSPR